MSSVGTFGTFTTARLGIWASQKGLSVTGNNIANINTIGYTRQRLEQSSLKTGGADRYANKYDVQVGQGVLCTGVSQIRDPYLDIRYRTEMSSAGYMDTTLSTLNDLAAILDEVGDGTDGYGIISANFDSFIKCLTTLGHGAGQADREIQLRAAAKELAASFNKYADKLQTLKENKELGLRKDVDKVNTILNNIRELNTAIRKSEIHGDNALEMRDERNLLIDELSEYVKINVVYTMEDVGAGRQVEKLTISLGDANPQLSDTDEAVLVNGQYAAQFVTPKLNPDYGSTDPNKADLKDFKYLDENGDGTNDILDAKQEFDENYNLGISKLLDSKGREWKEFKEQPLTLTPEQKAALDADGELSIDNGDGTRTLITGIKDALREVKDNAGTVIGYTGVFTTTTYSTVIEQFDDNDLYGRLQASRELLTEEGEFASTADIAVDEKAATKRGIPYYQKSLDLLARQFAKTINEANNGYLVDENGNYLKNTGTDEKPVYTTLDEITYRKDANGWISLTNAGATGDDVFTFKPNSKMTDDQLEAFQLKYNILGNITQKDVIDTLVAAGEIKPVGGNLFSIRNDLDTDEGINASNISISDKWSTGAIHVVPTFIKPFDSTLENSTQSDNITHMLSLMDKDLVYNPKDWSLNPADPDIAQSEHLFNGSFTEMLNNMFTVLGGDQRYATNMLNNFAEAATELDSSRDGVSGVDLNDEAMSLMQYSKSLNAAYRLMTTIDEALDRLINNTGVVGR